ncbi:MAG TPA: MerR family transcriptional regulator [Terriglobales bacterium]|nr:MerR family transcriptional regulator [Terriglobales bacterium]
MEYRIEQLAQAGGVAVDTIRFYQGKGLLDPPRRDGRVTWYAEHHLERLRRIRDLQQRGFTLAVIRRFLEGELESSDEALVEAVTAPTAPETLALDELAARSGVAVPLLRALEQAGLLLPVAGADEPRYPADDLDVLAAGLRLMEAGVPLGALMELAADHAASVERTARRAVDLFDQHVRERIQAQGLPAADAERQLLGTFRDLLEASGTLVRHHFQRALLRAARERIERSA